MSPSVNRSSDSPVSSDDFSPEVSSVKSPHSETPINESETTSNPATSATTEESLPTLPSDVQRLQPIPPPSEPMQYRAIGLIRGQYMPSADQLTRGTLVATDGTLIDAVLLGRVMSLVKNHLSLDQPHLWVVYPRSRQEDGNLHVQIVGVWEPEKLSLTTSTAPAATEKEAKQPEEDSSGEVSQPEVAPAIQEGYFSIRGEAIFYSKDEQLLIIKIRQSPRKPDDKIKFFKLKIYGALGEKVIGHFWDLHIQLEGNTLKIQEANDIGGNALSRSDRKARSLFKGVQTPEEAPQTSAQLAKGNDQLQEHQEHQQHHQHHPNAENRYPSQLSA
ncbi:MAG: hypothetical protein U7123_12030 [Potamolinea sp.]